MVFDVYVGVNVHNKCTRTLDRERVLIESDCALRLGRYRVVCMDERRRHKYFTNDPVTGRENDTIVNLCLR